MALANCPPETIFEICVDAAVRRGARLGIAPSAAASQILRAAEKDFGVPAEKLPRLSDLLATMNTNEGVPESGA